MFRFDRVPPNAFSFLMIDFIDKWLPSVNAKNSAMTVPLYSSLNE
jgi:hypothetical protein